LFPLKGEQHNAMSLYTRPAEKIKPNILEVISQHVSLRRAGKEYVGSCPFHVSVSRCSFAVNEDKGVFYCFGCGEGGDVLDFIMKLDGLTFPQALAELGMKSESWAERHSPRRRAAVKVVGWVNEQRQRLNVRIRALDEQIELADEIPDTELAESLWRERRIVADIRDDISRVEYLPDFVQLKEVIEQITEGWL
jgi:hypothetical protein